MTLTDAIDLIGLKDAIKKSFASVFGELNVASEVWFQKTKLLTIGRDNYADYIARKVGIFPLFATNKSASVETTYVRVDISNNIERDKYRSASEIEESLKRQRLGGDSDKRRRQEGSTPIESITRTSGGFSLVGTPGSGKTTIFRSIAVQAACGTYIRGRKRIPIYLAVRDLAISSQGILDASQSLLKQLGVSEASQVLEALLKSGNCIILLDGLDETSHSHQTALLHELLEIKDKHNSCIYCISARPATLLVGLPDFIKWETLPLSFSERLAFVEKWFSVIDPPKGQQLIEKSKNRPELLDLGSNPLLLSIVCALFYNDLDIPSEPNELYDRCLQGLLGGWDSFRNIARTTVLAEVPIRKRLIIVSWLAAALFEEGKVAFSPAELRATNILNRVAEVLRIPVIDADDLLKSLYNDFGLLIERSPNTYSFSHLTIHEYLVAKYVVDNRGEVNLLNRYRANEKWWEVIRLVAKMLPNADDFISRLQGTKTPGDPKEVALLESVWLSRPICSVELRIKLIKQLATKISSIMSRYSKFQLQRHKSGNTTLVISINTSAEMLYERNVNRTLRYLVSSFVTECLPSLLRIIKASGLGDDVLGVVDKSLFFQVLKREGNPTIQDVRFVKEGTNEVLQQTGDIVSSYLKNTNLPARFGSEVDSL